MFNFFPQNDVVAANTYVIVHPLDDVYEAKPDLSHLGRMPMNGTVKLSLQILRGYLVLMMGLVAYHVLGLAGVV